MWTYIYKDLLGIIPYLKNAAIEAGVLTLLYFLMYRRNEKFVRIRVGAYFLFFVYLSVVIEIALLSREPGSRSSMDLKLFSTWGVTWREHAYVLENILFFIPLGFFLPVLFEMQKKLSVLLCTAFLCSLSIEITQKLTARGFFQTDDIVTNVLGAGIGFLFCYILKRIK